MQILTDDKECGQRRRPMICPHIIAHLTPELPVIILPIADIHNHEIYCVFLPEEFTHIVDWIPVDELQP